MFYVMYGDWGECWGEYPTFEEAEAIAERLRASGEDVWICSD